MISKKPISLAVALILVGLLLLGLFLAKPEPEPQSTAGDYAEYETATVTQILADSTEADPTADGGFRGNQLLLAQITSGQYTGITMQVENFVGPLYGVPVEEGDSVVLIISTYSDGTRTATVFEYNRTLPLAIVVGLFLVTALAIGGKTGAKSLVALGLTLVCLFFVLLPLLLKGFPTLPTVFGVCSFVAVVTLLLVGGIGKKTLCAILGTLCGTGLALAFGLLAQYLTRIDGLRLEDVEPLLQLRQQGTPIGLKGLLVGGVVISALGAVMDVTMGIASSMWELWETDPSLSSKALLRSGMNIGRDMVGTMTNTLILALLGSSFTLILYLYTIGLSTHQLLSSAYLSIEVISSVSSSIGVILSIPLTALIGCRLFARN